METDDRDVRADDPQEEREGLGEEAESGTPEPEAAEQAPAAESGEGAAPEAGDETPEREPVAEAEGDAEPEGPQPEPEAEGDAEAEGAEREGDVYREAEPAAEPARAAIVELAGDARYVATGKRKTSVARVILRPGGGEFDLNGRSLDAYFPRRTLQQVVRQPLEATGLVGRVAVRARIHGGGISSQADAVRHGIAKALIEADPALRGELKRRQLLTRDPRVKERRKAGLKKARKRPQFSKR
jgi:small subunit ribosomal protein S9